MVFNIKRVFVTIICTALFFGCSAVSTVTAVDTPSGADATTDVNRSITSDSNTSGERVILDWPVENVETIGNLGDIGIDTENEKVIFGPRWKKFTKEELLEKEIDLNEAKPLFTVYYMEHKEGETTHTCWAWWAIETAGGTMLDGIPGGCVTQGH